MSKWNWDTDRNEASNVSVNDGVVTYFAEWDTDETDAIDLQEVADDFGDGYDHNGEPGPVYIVVTNLVTGEELEDEIEPEDDDADEDGDEDDGDEDGEDGDADEDEDEDEDDADEDGDDEDDTEDEGARAALWHGEIDFLDHYQPPGRRGR